MKRKTTKYTLLRSRVGNYLAWFEKSHAGLDWKVSPHAQVAMNFEGNPNVLDTALKLFKKKDWTVVHAKMTWTEIVP